MEAAVISYRAMYGAPEPPPPIPPLPFATTERERMIDEAVRNTGIARRMWAYPWWDLDGIYPDEAHVPSWARDIRAEFWRLHGMAVGP